MPKTTVSHFRRQIEDHFETLDLDVVCRKKNRAYTIRWRCNGEPMARLLPTGRDDDVEVFWWDSDRWQPVGEFGATFPLGEALEFITEDPDDLFFESMADDEFDVDLVSPLIALLICGDFNQLVICTLVGGAVGGAFSSPGLGGAFGAAVGLLGALVMVLRHFSVRAMLLPLLIMAIPAMSIGSAAGTLGGNVNQLVGGGVWGVICGSAVGVCCSLVVYFGVFPARLIGFAGGLIWAVWLVDAIHIRENFLGFALVAIVASLSAALFSAMARRFVTNIRPIVMPELYSEDGSEK